MYHLFFFKQKTAYEVRISDWSSDVCSSDLLEGRVLGGGADQDHRAVLDIGQEAVLLGAVEAVDLVDEQQSAAPGQAALPGALEHLAQVGDAGEHRRSDEHTSELQSLMRNSYAVFCLK